MNGPIVTPFNENIILATDSYKQSHHAQLPKDVRYVRSSLTPRGGPFPNMTFYAALRVIMPSLFGRKVEPWMIDEAQEFVDEHMGPNVFNRKGWEHIVNKHGGWLPLRIRAPKEGTRIPVKNAVIFTENTDPEVPWLPGHFETAFYPWHPIDTATLSNTCRHIILKHLQNSGDPALIDFMLQDFGYRGTTDPATSMQAAIGGSAHLVNFKGSDTIPGVLLARRYYGCKMAGFSVPAAEHSTITAWKRLGEADAYRNMLHVFPTGIVAVVSDSYDIYHACEAIWGGLLHDDVLARQGVLVVRPDSGDPVEVTLKCLRILGDKFGSTLNRKNYRVLNPKVRLIYGDGIGPVTIDTILTVMEINGWSADNICFGMGGALLQEGTRDRMKWAFKANGVETETEAYGVSKDPITDKGKASQASTSGLGLTLITNGTEYRTVDVQERVPDGWHDDTVTYYDTGRLDLHDNWDQICERVRTADPVPAIV